MLYSYGFIPIILFRWSFIFVEDTCLHFAFSMHRVLNCVSVLFILSSHDDEGIGDDDEANEKLKSIRLIRHKGWEGL